VTPNGTPAERPRGTGTPNPQDKKARSQHTLMKKIASKNDALDAMKRMGSPLPKTPKNG